MLNSKDAEAILQSLVGQKLVQIYRFFELVGIGFRDTSDHGKTKNYGRFHLSMVFHLQCPFRIETTDKIVIGREDLFVSSTDDFDVDLAEDDTCVFDGIVKDFGARYDSEYVRKVTVNSFGDVTVELTTLKIRIFVAGSTEKEAWRFFPTDDVSEHLVNENGKLELT